MGKKSRSKNKSKFPKRNKRAKAALKRWKTQKCNVEKKSTVLLPNLHTEVCINTLAPGTVIIPESSQFLDSHSDVYVHGESNTILHEPDNKNIDGSSLLGNEDEQVILDSTDLNDSFSSIDLDFHMKLREPVDEEITIKEEEIDMDIEDFDSKRYLIEFPTDQDEDTISGIDISCVKQEIVIVESDDINCSLNSQPSSVRTYKNRKTVKTVKSTENVISSCGDTPLNVPSSTNNDVIHKKSREHSSEIVKKVDLKRILNTPQENISKPSVHLRTVCILCAGSDSNNNKPIAHFAKMILDFSGVDILNTKSPPVACNSCFKQLKIIDVFKKQIIYTNNLIMNAAITLKSTPAYDPGKVSKMSNVWEEADEETDEETDDEAENWFTLQTRKNFSKTTSEDRNKPSKVNSNLNNKNMLPSVNPEDNTEDLDNRGSKPSKVNSNLNNKNMQPSVNPEDNTEDLDNRPFLCAVCGNQYRTMKRLKVHSENIHGEKKHLCYICGNPFNSSGLLKNHLRTHSGEKPFPCEYCNRKFSLKWNLYQHRRLHSNILPYKCKLCPASYRHNVTLKKHVVKSHTAAECAVSSSSQKNCGSEMYKTTTDIQNSTNEGVISDK